MKNLDYKNRKSVYAITYKYYIMNKPENVSRGEKTILFMKEDLKKATQVLTGLRCYRGSRLLLPIFELYVRDVFKLENVYFSEKHFSIIDVKLGEYYTINDQGSMLYRKVSEAA